MIFHTEMIFQVSIITSIPRNNSLENFLVKLDYVLDGHVAGIARSTYVSDSLLGKSGDILLGNVDLRKVLGDTDLDRECLDGIASSLSGFLAGHAADVNTHSLCDGRILVETCRQCISAWEPQPISRGLTPH